MKFLNVLLQRIRDKSFVRLVKFSGKGSGKNKDITQDIKYLALSAKETQIFIGIVRKSRYSNMSAEERSKVFELGAKDFDKKYGAVIQQLANE